MKKFRSKMYDLQIFNGCVLSYKDIEIMYSNPEIVENRVYIYRWKYLSVI